MTVVEHNSFNLPIGVPYSMKHSWVRDHHKAQNLVQLLEMKSVTNSDLWIRVDHGEYAGSIGRFVKNSTINVSTSSYNKFKIKFENSRSKTLYWDWDWFTYLENYTGPAKCTVAARLATKIKPLYDKLGRSIEVGDVGFAPVYVSSVVSMEFVKIEKITSYRNIKVITIPLTPNSKSIECSLKDAKNFIKYDDDLSNDLLIAKLKV